MDGPRRYYAKWNESDRKKPHDFTYLWNLKYKTNAQNRNRFLDTENKVAREEGIWEDKQSR